MVEPIVVPRAAHRLSRRDIDPDALKVLYRLRDAGHTAYLVGGSVRDLLLGRRPKDFDIGTSAHPSQIRRLFRNCYIVGRRFRLAHVKFGSKTIEVATFRRQVPRDAAPPGQQDEAASPRPDPSNESAAPEVIEGVRDLLIHRDNTFGTPEEDAFRRDFTINALFYDIATFSIIDYVGGLADLEAGVVRAIGDPDERFSEDPVRMLRAVSLAERLQFRLDDPVVEAIGRHRAEIQRAAPARLMEEYYKVLRSGAAASVFRSLGRHGLLAPITPDIDQPENHPIWSSLEALDAYRRKAGSSVDALTNPLLLGTLLVPLGFTERSGPTFPDEPYRPWLGMLPAARRDVDRLRHILMLRRRLADPRALTRGTRGILARAALPDTLRWLEIHGRNREIVERWRQLQSRAASLRGEAAHQRPPEGRPRRRRRRRRYPVVP